MQAVRAPARLAWLLFTVLTLAGVARIVASYPHNSVTADERSHLSAGMEWWMQGTYRYEPQHPPLARIAAAAGPYLAGYTNFQPEGFWVDGHKILFEQGDFRRVLTLARLGALPFFIAGCLVVFLWTREILGPAAAVLGTFLYSTAPPALAHGGLATTDMAAGSLIPAAVFTCWRAFRSSSPVRWALFGAVAGLALLAKFTGLLYLGVCLPAIGVAALLADGRLGPARKRLRAISRGLLVGGLTACLVVWAGFRFSFGPLSHDPARSYPAIDRVVGERGFLHDTAYRFARVPVPAPEFAVGVRDVMAHADRGHAAYLLGRVSPRGWWYFFPVALAVKTPLASLLLFLVGASAALFLLRRRQFSPALVPLGAAALTVLAAMPGSINIGVRHVLPVYVYGSIVAAAGGLWLARSSRRRWLGPAALVLLLPWQGAASAASHPYPLTYFNELALLTDDPILVDSDRDWGQYVYQLQRYALSRGIDELRVALLGFKERDCDVYRPPRFRMLRPDERPAGWLAVSMHRYYVVQGYQWLHAYRPVDTVGNAVYLFHLEEKKSAGVAKSP
ncbi:MAG: glycosyltransferase family 39 protein [Bryobacteraceae bacterium]|nr:glycosyltransferase family 39 protein [Bryobacteraceae bacterium]